MRKLHLELFPLFRQKSDNYRVNDKRLKNLKNVFSVNIFIKL